MRACRHTVAHMNTSGTGTSDMNDLPRHADVVFVGAGHNALVAAAYLLEAGRSVVLLEQMPQPGGWVRTAELGAPGFHHDRWSAMHSPFVRGPGWRTCAAAAS
jgi:phytoene dehydrogenase-like protein